MRSQLEPILRAELATAKKIYVATALINSYGYQVIMENLSSAAEIQFLVGINLPSDVEVIEDMFRQQSAVMKSRIFIGAAYFHPKVYLLQAEDGQMKAYVGSANTTGGGLLNNIEMSTEVRDQDVCNDLLHWFQGCWGQGAEITESFLVKYREKLKKIKKREFSTRADVAGLKKLLKPVLPAVYTDRSVFPPFFSTANFDAYSSENELDYSAEADARRYMVRRKFRELHQRIYQEFAEHGMIELYRHSHPPSLISHYQYRRCFNKKELKSMWLQYGYPKSDYRNKFGDHPRIQVILHREDLSVWLVVGKDYGSRAERTRFKTALADTNFRNYVFSLFVDLGEIYDIFTNGGRERHISHFSDPDSLAEFLIGEQLDSYFIVSRSFRQGDTEISDCNIAQTVLAEFERLYPLYSMFRSFKQV